MTKTNAQKLVDAGNLNVDPKPPVTTIQSDEAAQCSMLVNAIDLIANAFTLEIIVPGSGDDTEEFDIRDSATGETETIRGRKVNRYGKQRRGMLNQVMRQLDYSIDAGLKELDGVKRDVRSAMSNLQRSQDPTKLMDFIGSKTRWADVISDQVSHAQALRDAAATAYFDIEGRPYVAYDAKAPARTVAVPVAANEPVNPVLAAAAALLNK